jgi:hypothetical protein
MGDCMESHTQVERNSQIAGFSTFPAGRHWMQWLGFETVKMIV